MLFEKFKMVLNSADVRSYKTPALNGETCLFGVIKVFVEANRSNPGKVVSVVDVVAKTLAYVKSVALAEINTTQLSNVDPKEIFWVLTVPAIWTDVAKAIVAAIP
jgi:hypothetical protein